MKNLILLLTLFLFTSLNAKSQELPTIGEVFDFNIGDEYVFVSSSYYGSYYYQRKYIEVNYTADSTEVSYTTVYNTYTSIDGTTFYPYLLDDTILTVYTNLDSSMFYFEDLFQYDTLHYFNDSLCGSEIYGASYSTGGPLPEGNVREYGIGLGQTYYYHSGDTGYSSGILVYYLKDGVECGTPIISILGVDSPSNSTNISVFPTLFKDLVTIESDFKDDLNLQLYSLSGQEVFSKQLSSSSTQPDFSFMKSGTYVYVIRSRNDNQVIKSGKLIKGE